MKEKTEVVKKTNIGFSVVKNTGIGLAIIAVLYLLFVVLSDINKLRVNFEEVRFALDKPQIVKSVRMDFETRQKKLENDLLQRQKTVEEKLIEEVTAQLKN